MEQNHAVIVLFCRDVVVGCPLEAIGKLAELVIVRGEDRAATRCVVKVLGHGPGDREPVVGARAAPDLVQDHERSLGRAAKDGGRFHHFDHEGALTAGEVIARPDPRVHAIDDADPGAPGGDEPPGLGHDHRKRRLTHGGRLPRHVRPGEEHEARGLGVQLDRIGDEAVFGRVAFDGGVAAVFEEERPAGIDIGTDIAAAVRDLRQRRARVDGRDDPGQPVKTRRLLADRFAQVEERRRLERARPFVGVQDAVLELRELGRDESFAVRDGLLANVVVGDGVELGFGDLDVVPEDPRELDLERADAGAFSFAALEVEDDVFGRRRKRSELVEIGEVTVRENAALPFDRRRLVDQGGLQEGEHVCAKVDPFERRHRIVERAAGARGELSMKRLGAREAVSDDAQVSWRRQAHRGAHRQSFDVPDLGESRPRLIAAAGVGKEQLHGVVAAPDAFDVGQRFEQAGPKRPCAHGGLGFVEQLKKRATTLAVQGAHQLQVADRRVVEDQSVAGSVERGRVDR